MHTGYTSDDDVQLFMQ